MTVFVDLQAFASITRIKLEEVIARRPQQFPDVEFCALGVDFYFQSGVLGMALDTAENVSSVNRFSTGFDRNGTYTNNTLEMSYPLEEDIEIPRFREFIERYFGWNGGTDGDQDSASIRTWEGFVIDDIFQQMEQERVELELLVLSMITSLFASSNSQLDTDERAINFGNLKLTRPFRITSYAPEGCHGYTFLI